MPGRHRPHRFNSPVPAGEGPQRRCARGRGGGRRVRPGRRAWPSPRLPQRRAGALAGRGELADADRSTRTCRGPTGPLTQGPDDRLAGKAHRGPRSQQRQGKHADSSPRPPSGYGTRATRTRPSRAAAGPGPPSRRLRRPLTPPHTFSARHGSRTAQGRWPAAWPGSARVRGTPSTEPRPSASGPPGNRAVPVAGRADSTPRSGVTGGPGLLGRPGTRAVHRRVPARPGWR